MELGLGVSVETDAPVADAPPAEPAAPTADDATADSAPAVEAAAAKPAALDSALGTSRAEPFDPSIPWSVRKKAMSTVVVPTFTAGFDPTAPDELQKAKQRMSRFGTAEQIEQSKEDEADEEARQKRAARFGVTVPIATTGGRAMHALGLSVAQVLCANEHRVDPPSSDAELASEKVHISVLPIDKQRFPRIRSDDLMAQFKVFGPTYVEWLGDTSCNIHFVDADCARRALVRTRRARARAAARLRARGALLVARSWCRVDRGLSLCADAIECRSAADAARGGCRRGLRRSRGPRLAPPPSTHHQASGRPLGFGRNLGALSRAHRARDRHPHGKTEARAAARAQPVACGRRRGACRAPRALPSVAFSALHTRRFFALSSFRAPRRSASADARPSRRAASLPTSRCNPRR